MSAYGINVANLAEKCGMEFCTGAEKTVFIWYVCFYVKIH